MESCCAKIHSYFLLNMPHFALPATKQRWEENAQTRQNCEMNTGNLTTPGKSRRTSHRTWPNAEPRDRWIAPSELQIQHCSGATAAALREGSSATSPCPEVGSRATNSRSLAPRPHLPVPPLADSASQLPLALIQSFLTFVVVLCVRAQGWCASSKGVRDGLREAS